MPKGRLCNPSIEKEGIWFPHIDVSNKLPMTSTQEMFHRSSWKEARLPHLCTTRNKGLGRKKTPLERRQHSSRNFNLLCHDQPPRATSYYDGFTVNQTSYRGRQDTEKPFCRRYPKHHHEKSASMRDPPENHFMWFARYH